MNCQYPGCPEEASVKVLVDTESIRGLRDYCDAHAEQAAAESGSEYVITCPNCQCQFGVN